MPFHFYRALRNESLLSPPLGSAAGGTLAPPPRISARLGRLTLAITSLLDDFSMVSFLPLNLNDEESTALVLRAAEQLTQYGEDLEPRDRDYD